MLSRAASHSRFGHHCVLSFYVVVFGRVGVCDCFHHVCVVSVCGCTCVVHTCALAGTRPPQTILGLGAAMDYMGRYRSVQMLAVLYFDAPLSGIGMCPAMAASLSPTRFRPSDSHRRNWAYHHLKMIYLISSCQSLEVCYKVFCPRCLAIYI